MNFIKTLTLITGLVCLNSCSQTIEVPGVWVIDKMRVDGKICYPNTSYSAPHLSIQIAGSEGSEKITFNEYYDSSLTFPGMGGYELKARYSVRQDSISFTIDTLNNKQDLSNNLTKYVFLRTFKAEHQPKDENLMLLSDSVNILLIREDYLFKKRLREVF